MPGYEQAQRVARDGSCGVSPAARSAATWADGSKAFEYDKDGKRYRFDVATRRATEMACGGGQVGRVGSERAWTWHAERGRGSRTRPLTSPDGRLKAFYAIATCG